MNSILKKVMKICIFCLLCSLSITSFSNEGYTAEKNLKIGFLPDTHNLTSDTLYQFGTSDFLSNLLYHTYSFKLIHWFDLKEEANNPDLIEKNIENIFKNNQLDYLYQTKLINENNQWSIDLIEWSKENNSFKSLGKFLIKEDDFFNTQFQMAQKILSSQGINLSSSQMQDLNYFKSNYLSIQAYNQFLKGYILYLKGDYATSEQIFKQAISLDEKQVRYKYYHAYSLFYQEKNVEAQKEFANAEKISQNYPKIISGIGNYYNQINEFEKAIDSYSRALAINSNDSEFYLGRCESNYYLSQFDKAISDCNRALDFGENNWWNYHLLGLSFYGKKDYSTSISFLSKSIEVNPSNAPSYSWRCKTVLEMNKSNQQIAIESGIGIVFPKYTLPISLRKSTEQDCNKSVELAPEWGYAYLNRSLFWMSQNEDNKALIDLNKSRELDSSQHESALMRGLLNFKLKKQEQGLIDLSEAIKLGSKDSIPYNLAITLSAIGKHQQSLLLLRPLIELNPNNVLLMQSYLESLLQTDATQEALSLADSLIKLDPQNATSYKIVGKIYLTTDLFQQAFPYFNQAIEYDPKDADNYFFRGFIYQSQNEHQLAKSDFTKVLNLNPQNPKTFFYRAQSNFALEQFPEAIYDFTQFINKAPNDDYILRAYFIRGSIYGDSGQYQKALSDFAVAEKDPELRPYVLRNKGNVYTYMKQCAKANLEFKKACQAGDSEACQMKCP